MLSSRLLSSLLGSSALRIPPVRFSNKFIFPSPSIRFNRLCSSATVLDTANITSDSTQISVPPSQINHPWPEWVSFIDRLKSKGYFNDGPSTNPPPSAAVATEIGNAEDEAKVSNTDVSLIKHACLNFARERFDIFKSLSRQDIQSIVEKGCPSLLRKAVNSAKRLRAHLHLDEGEVCGGCNLRGSCDRAYTIINDSEDARTVDIVRILLLYALDESVISGGEMSVGPGREYIEVSARRLLSELIELSETVPDPDLPKPSLTKAQQSKKPFDDRSYKNVEMKRGDWMCPECDFLNFARNLRCLKCQTEGPKRVDTNDIEMKKGDWNCSGCGFMNFSSKMSCFRCRGARPKRDLNPGEWECPSCNFLNYRRNMVCKKCECDRPKDKETQSEQQIWKKPSMRTDKQDVYRRSNFD